MGLYKKTKILHTIYLPDGDIEKPRLGPHPVLGLEEFRTEAELDQLLFDMNTMRLQVRVVMMK